MSNSWEWSDIHYSENDAKLAHLTNYVLGNRFPGINTDIAINFNLYRFIVEHLGEPDLEKRITKHGLPIFSQKDMADIQATVRKQKDLPYTQRLLKKQTQKGGSTDQTVKTTNKKSPLDDDPSRSKFWDKLFRKLTHGISSRIPPSWDGVFWYIHILYHLEQIDVIGPFLSVALDSITLSLPVMAEISSSGVEKLVGLVPVPYASLAGEVLGYALSLLFIILAIFLNNSRKHFGSSFKAGLEAIPIVGDAAALAAQSVETGADRFLNYKKKMVKSVSAISPTAGQVVYSYVPDVDIHAEVAPPLDDSTLKGVERNIVEYGKKQTGLDELLEKIPDPEKVQEALEKSVKGGKRKTRKTNTHKAHKRHKNNKTKK